MKTLRASGDIGDAENVREGASGGHVLNSLTTVSVCAPRVSGEMQLQSASAMPAPVHTASRAAGAYPAVKRVVEPIIALILLVVLMPILLLAACAVLVTLGRPVVLRQQRVGLGGEPFVLHKLRTMRPSRRCGQSRRMGPLGSDAAEQERRAGVERRCTHKHPCDPRLVPVGRFLRRWSLDELPQLYDVVRGRMALVGPRPEMVEIVDRYAPWQHRRHAVKPGITGLWQVSDRGQGGQLMHERTDIDLQYVDELSLALDLRVLLLTLPAALGKRCGI